MYDEDTHKWSGRSKEMEEQYKKDVTLFYKYLLVKKKPAKVTSFEDIELLDFHNLRRCKNNDYFEDLLVSKNDILFQKYLTKIEEIQQGTRSYKKQLLYILKSMFVKKEPQSDEGEDEYIIHPDLNMKTLLEKQKQIKNCIVQMYSSCEKNFIEALLLYEKMYENRYGELVNAQVNNIGFHEMNQNQNNANAEKVPNYQNENNMILNGNLLLNNKIKMPNINNNNAFKLSNQSSVNPAPTTEPEVQALPTAPLPSQLPDSLPESLPESLPDSLPSENSPVLSPSPLPAPSPLPTPPQQPEVLPSPSPLPTPSPSPSPLPTPPQQPEVLPPPLPTPPPQQQEVESVIPLSNDLPSLVDILHLLLRSTPNPIPDPSPLPSLPSVMLIIQLKKMKK